MDAAQGREPPEFKRSWADWADGQPWRLKRGKHYRGEPKAVEKEAEAAAREMGKALITSKDSSGKYDYVWVQFVDYALTRGEPCPHCRGEVMTKHSNVLATCDSCGSSLKLVEPKGSTEKTDGRGSALKTGATGSTPRDGQEAIPKTDGDVSAAERANKETLFERGRGRHGEILTTRLLSADGNEREQILVSEEAVVEISYRFHVAGLSVQAGAVFSVGREIVLQSSQRPVALERSGIYTVALRLPAHRLRDDTYSVTVTALVLNADGTSGNLVLMNALSFRAVLEAGDGETEQDSPAKVGGPGSLVWSVVAWPGDVRADGHDRARAGDGTKGGSSSGRSRRDGGSRSQSSLGEAGGR